MRERERERERESNNTRKQKTFHKPIINCAAACFFALRPRRVRCFFFILKKMKYTRDIIM